MLFDDGRMKSASYDNSSGFGLRAIAGEAHGYAHSGEMTIDAMRRAAATVSAVTNGYGGQLALPPRAGTNRALYTSKNPLEATPFGDKVSLMQEIDAYARQADPLVKQVTVSLGTSWQAMRVMRPDGYQVADIRPLVRIGIAVVLERDGRMESGQQRCRRSRDA